MREIDRHRSIALTQARQVAHGSPAAVYWRIEDNLPLVGADHHGLLQSIFNLARNATRPLQNSARKELRIVAQNDGRCVNVRFHNSGPPIADPESSFKPFQPGASGGGLGLYVSRPSSARLEETSVMNRSQAVVASPLR
jgi:C4-dicarboxylate-specific signal transduction histidine kinase